MHAPTPPLPPADRRRYLSGQADRYDQFLKAAADYAQHFEAKDHDWCYGKPFDREPGNPYFLTAMPTLCGALQVMNLHLGATILEVGSGPGWLTEMLVALGYKVVALDPAAAMHTLSRRRLELAAKHWRLPLPLPVTYLAEPLEECSLPDESADAVLFYESLHHIVDEKKGLAQAYRILKPGGIFTVVGEGAWAPGWAGLEAAIEQEMAEYGTLENPFTHEYLDHLLAATGFRDQVRYHGVCGFFPVGQGGRAIAEVAQSPATSTNCLTAQKPYAVPTTADPSAKVNAALTVQSAKLSALGRLARVQFTVTNTGPSVLLSRRQGQSAGYVTISLCRRNGEMVEAGRVPLPRTLAPGESTAVVCSMAIPAGLPLDGWTLDLLNEGYFWFHQFGVPSVPVTFEMIAGILPTQLNSAL